MDNFLGRHNQPPGLVGTQGIPLVINHRQEIAEWIRKIGRRMGQTYQLLRRMHGRRLMTSEMAEICRETMAGWFALTDSILRSIQGPHRLEACIRMYRIYRQQVQRLRQQHNQHTFLLYRMRMPDGTFITVQRMFDRHLERIEIRLSELMTAYEREESAYHDPGA